MPKTTSTPLPRFPLESSPGRVAADSTEEVRVEDILLEVYAEPRAPIPTPTPLPWLPPPSESPASGETPSVGPMTVSAVPSSSMMPAAPAYLWPTLPPPVATSDAPAPRVPSRARRVARALATLVWSVLLVAVGASAGVVLVLRPPTPVQRAFATARSHLRPAPAPAPAPDTSPAIPVTALPPPSVPSTRGRLLLPPSARGHRVFVDAVAVPLDAPDTLLLRCGHHVVRIGSAGHPRDLDVPCGGELAIP